MGDDAYGTKKKLMIAYRSQYEPLDRALLKMAREQKLGELKEFISANSQNMGDPKQWRLKKALAGAGRCRTWASSASMRRVSFSAKSRSRCWAACATTRPIRGSARSRKACSSCCGFRRASPRPAAAATTATSRSPCGCRKNIGLGRTRSCLCL